jgi:NADH-quinone oxidoreductase subunit L
VMIWPLVVLAVGAVLAGFVLGPTGLIGHFLGGSPSFTLGHAVAAHHFNDPGEDLKAGFGLGEADHGYWGYLIGTFVAACGIGAAYFLHLRDRRMGEVLPEMFPVISRPIEEKYFVDQIYQWVIVEPLRLVGNVFRVLDNVVVDGLTELAGVLPRGPGWVLRVSVQRGYLQGYAAAMLFGVAAILLVMFL